MTAREEQSNFPFLFPRKPTALFPEPSFNSYTPEALLRVGLDSKLFDASEPLSLRNQPHFQPLATTVNRVQAESILLCLKQYYRQRGNLGFSQEEPFRDIFS